MHPITTDHPAVNALPRAGAHLLIDKMTGRRYPAAPTGSWLLTSAPYGWCGIIVEQHRLPPAEMPEHSVIGHGISVNVGAHPSSFAWTRGRDGWDDRPTNPGHCRINAEGQTVLQFACRPLTTRPRRGQWQKAKENCLRFFPLPFRSTSTNDCCAKYEGTSRGACTQRAGVSASRRQRRRPPSRTGGC